MNNAKKILPELLCPAGSFEALTAAIEGGADAVYFGASDFNARMRAKNFTEDELEKAITLCRQYGVKAYITLNTRLRQGEIKAAADCAVSLWEKGCDAFIVADCALASHLKKICPEMELHASTQLSGHSSLDGKALKNMGFSRMVCPREMSKEEIFALTRDCPIEIEMFVHGAHCVSFSGQCMMSFAMGGRSGNRGECAQPCRQNFTMGVSKNAYPLSLKDMCLAQHLESIIESGVASLKIEGRQKSADYVYGVCRIYRRLLDEGRNASPQEVEALSRLFSRDGFTDGYYKKSYPAMLGVRTQRDKFLSETASSFDGLKRKIPLHAKLTLAVGAPAQLYVTGRKRNTTVFGEVVTKDFDRAMSRDAALQNMSRLGGTAFVLDGFDFSADDGAFYTLSGINKLRREAVEKLCAPKGERFFAQPKNESEVSKKPEGIESCATVTDAGQITSEMKEFFDKIYIPLKDAKQADGNRVCIDLGPLLFDEDFGKAAELLKSYTGEVQAHGFGQASFVKSLGLIPVASYRFNIFSPSAAEVVSDYALYPTLSPEVPLAAARNMKTPFSLIAYGKIGLMHTMRCLLSDGGALCPFHGAGGREGEPTAKKSGSISAKSGGMSCDGTLCRGRLVDRLGVSFPVVGLEDCTNIIYNSAAVYMADKMEQLAFPYAARHHFLFTDESAEECKKIIEAYKRKTPPDKNLSVRRLK